MTERDYLTSLRRHWRLGLSCVILAVLAAVIFTATVTPTYRATATVFVSVRIDEPGSAYQAGMFTQQRVQSYAAIVDSPSVMEVVVDELELELTADELAGRVTAEAPIDTVLLKISAEHTSAVVAREIANAAAAAFADQVPVLEQVAGTAESPVEATVVRPAGLGARTQPGARLNIALGLFLGAIIGFGAVVLRDRLDHTVRAEELEDLLGLPLLGRISGGDGVERDQVICLAQPSSRPAEEFRSVRTNLRFADADELPRSIVVTSALDGEGTAGVLGNLAVVLAQAGDPVVVVCADLRHPRLDELVRVHRRPGLTSVLSGHATLDEALQRWGDPALPLWALAPGPLPGNPSEVLGSKELELLIRRLEDRATFVLIETPPALPFTDAAVVSAIASGVVLVARSGRTPHDDVSSAVRALRAVGARLYGAVVTTPPRRLIDLGDTTSATTPRREEP